MDELLTSEELDAVLHAISNPNLTKSEIIEPRKIRVHDFKKPDRFSRDHLRSFQHIFEIFARISSTKFTLLLDKSFNFQVSSLEQVTYKEFSKLTHRKSVLGILSLKPLLGFAILEFQPQLNNLFINSLIGGKMDDNEDTARELTDLEMQILKNIQIKLLEIIREVFLLFFPINPVLEKISTHSENIAKPRINEFYLQLTLNVKIANVESLMKLYIPYSTLEPVLEKISKKNFNPTNLINKDYSQKERIRRIQDSCIVKTYSEFQIGNVNIHLNAENQEILHAVNINLSHEARTNHYFKTIFKNYIQSEGF